MHERRLRPEWMDRPDLDVMTHQTALQALSRINACSRSHRLLWPSIQQLASQRPDRVLRVLDVACGGGDVTLRLAQTACRAGATLQIDGCDISQTAVRLAQRRAEHAGKTCQFFQFDALTDNWPTDYDVICCSLFLHHLSADSAVSWLASAKSAAKELVLVSDLVRSRWGYFLACFFSRLLTRSPVVHFDGPVSVAGAFTPTELQDLARRSGLNGATIQRYWPARMLLRWSRS